ncbi:MAG: hypothetical protein L3J05_00270 [Robiginitomaculum sp.]|nr:hypothetical protein [Robiginitomaculum sp.]
MGIDKISLKLISKKTPETYITLRAFLRLCGILDIEMSWENPTIMLACAFLGTLLGGKTGEDNG